MTFPSDLANTINAVLDTKLEEMTARLEAVLASKLDELEARFKKILEKEVKQFKDEFNEAVDHVEHVLKQDIDYTWEYAVRNEQYSRKKQHKHSWPG